VRQISLKPAVTSSDSFEEIVDVLADVLARLDNLAALELDCTSRFASPLLPLFPSTLSTTLQVLYLGMKSYPGGFEAVAAAAYLHTFPFLHSVMLEGVGAWDEGMPLAVKALRGLRRLLQLQINCLHPTFAHPWASSLASLRLEAGVVGIHATTSLLRDVLERRATTLQQLTMPYLVGDETHDSQPFHLPRLDDLTLTGEFSAAVLLAFSASPLRKLQVELHTDPGALKYKTEPTKKLVLKCRETLKEVSVTAVMFGIAVRGDQEALDQLGATCSAIGLSYNVEWARP
jgi:hypothetical protein